MKRRQHHSRSHVRRLKRRVSKLLKRLPLPGAIRNRVLNYVAPLVEVLYLDWRFRLGMGFCVALLLAAAVMLPKVWRVTPPDMPDVRISLLDRLQAQSLARGAKRKESIGDWESARMSWWQSIANHPAHLGYLRGYLRFELALVSGDSGERAHEFAIGRLPTFLKLSGNQPMDVDLAVRLLEANGSLSTLALLIEGFPEAERSPFQQVVYAKAVYDLGRLPQFMELWGNLSSGLRETEEHRAYEMVYACLDAGAEPSTREDAFGRFRDWVEEADTDRAYRVFNVAAGALGDLASSEWALAQLDGLEAVRLGDYLVWWQALARAGEVEQARQEALASAYPPEIVSEALSFAQLLGALGEEGQIRGFLETHLERFSNRLDYLMAYSNQLILERDWPTLLGFALGLEEASNGGRAALALSRFLEGFAHFEMGNPAASDSRWSAMERSFDAFPYWLALSAIEEIADRGKNAMAMRLASSIADGRSEDLGYWLLRARLAIPLGDSEEFYASARRAYNLAPNDVSTALLYSAAALFKREDPEAAVGLTWRIAESFPQVAGARINHAFALMLNGRVEESERLASELRGLRLSNQESHALGLLEFELATLNQQWPQAMAMAERLDALELSPLHRQLYDRVLATIPEGAREGELGSETQPTVN